MSVTVLNVLKQNGLVPSLIITTEDKPKGRNLVLTPPDVKKWSDENSVPYLQPKTLKSEGVLSEIQSKVNEVEVAVVASYGKIIPKRILDFPKHGTINVHPSLLPKLRGASPIESAILTEKETGVTIIKLDEKVDHGPILAQEKTINFELDSIPYANELEEILAQKGGEMLLEVFEKILNGTQTETPQKHRDATFCQKLDKKDALVDLSGSPSTNIRKIKAYQKLKPYFFDSSNQNKRVVIKKARLEKEVLIIENVLPEGGKEISYQDYLNGIQSSILDNANK